MSQWSQAKFDFCTNGKAETEFTAGSDLFEEPESSSCLTGITVIDIMPGGKSTSKILGYKVDKIILPGGKFFAGVVILSSGTKNGDLFNQLKEVFESQNEITKIEKPEEIPAFKETIEKRYKGAARFKILDECRARLLDSPEIKWWKIQEVESIVIDTREKCFPPAKEEKEILDEAQEMVEKDTKETTVKLSQESVKKSPQRTEKSSREEKNGKPSEGKSKVQEVEEKVVIEKHEASALLEKDTPDKVKEVEKVDTDENRAKVKELKDKLDVAEKVLERKDKQLASFKKDFDDMEASVKRETKEMKAAMALKDKEIKILSDEIVDLEGKMKNYQKTISEMTRQKMDWCAKETSEVEEYEKALKIKEEEVDNISKEKDLLQETLGEALKVKEKEFEDDKKENESLKQSLSQTKEQLEEKSRKLSELTQQTKEIEDNAKFLQSELLRQKMDMQTEIDKAKNEVMNKTKEVEDIKNELEMKNKQLEMKNKQLQELEIKEAATPSVKETVDTSSFHGIAISKLDKILAIIEPRQTQASSVNPPRPQPAESGIDVQVSRVRSTETKILMVGHPEVLRNFENIPTLKNSVADLIRSDNLETVTGDYEGFVLKGLEKEVSQKLEAKLFSEVAREGRGNKFTTVVLLPGNFYTAMSVLEENKGKSPYMVDMKMTSAKGTLVTDTVGLLNVSEGAVKKIIVVIDPSSDVTYEFSKSFVEKLEEKLIDWKESFTGGGQMIIEVCNTTADQVKSGTRCSDKNDCLEALEKGASVWLDRKSVTGDKLRVSKLATIGIFNKIIDLSTNSTPPAKACKDCGVQQSSSYGAKCNPYDVGEFKSCRVCGRDNHDQENCWAMKFQSERACPKQICKKSHLKHNPAVHDIIDKKVQEEVKQKLNQKIEFWGNRRIKRPFVNVGQEGKEGPPPKFRKGN